MNHANQLTFVPKLVVTLSLVLTTSLSLAESAEAYENQSKDPTKSPLGCKDVGYQFQLNVLNILPEVEGDRQSLYFIYNRLSTPINLFQMLKDDSTRSTYLNHVIRPQQWAVLSTSEKELKYICTIEGKKTRYGKVINCSESLKVCEYARVKFGLNNRGNYWVVNSTTRGSAVGDVVRYGIIPR
ncbi:MAG: endopeptidase IV [Legionellaceae bacterium]|nr:endopeptidase IV [Legionellaceae bacterium]